jgi:hypothetical protein
MCLRFLNKTLSLLILLYKNCCNNSDNNDCGCRDSNVKSCIGGLFGFRG